MPGKPFDWNVVVTGAWNTAILTPNGIASRLFGLPPETPVEVLVPLDRQDPIRVVHDGMTVVPSSNRLVVAPINCTAQGLGKASKLAIKAIQSLPETPTTAAGINVRYRFDSLPDELIKIGSSGLDDRLAETDQKILAKTLRRSLAWKAGLLNIEVHEGQDASGFLIFNFHRESTKGRDLEEWLGQVESMTTSIEGMLQRTLKVKSNEVQND